MGAATRLEPSRRLPGELTRAHAVVLLLLMALAFVTNAADRQVFLVMVSTIDKQFGFSLNQGGLLATVFGIGIAITGIPTGYLLDRWTRKNVILLGTAVYSLGTLMTAFSGGFGDMFTYRLVSGIGEGLQNAALYSAVGAFFSSYQLRNTAIGVVSLGYATGAALAPIYGASLMLTYGWMAPFIVFGLVGLIIAALILVVVPLRFSEQKEIRAVASEESLSGVPRTVWSRNMFILIVVAIVTGAAEYGYLGMYPTFLIKHLGYSAKAAAGTFMMFGLGDLAAPLAGYFGDRLGQRRVILITLFGSMFCGLMMFDVVKTPGLQDLFTFFEGVFAGAFLYNNIYGLMQRSARPEAVGRASGIFVTAFYLASGLAGYLFAALVGALGWGTAGLIQVVLVPFIAVAAILMVRERELVRV